MSVVARLAILIAVAPGPAHACATCLGSAYGDRTFNLAFLSLLVMPFAVSAVIAGVLAHAYRLRRQPRPVDHPIKETT